MSELKNHLYFLLADNIDYNPAFNVFIEKDGFANSGEWMKEADQSVVNDEDFFINVLIETDIPFLIYGACFNLAAIGTQKKNLRAEAHRTPHRGRQVAPCIGTARTGN